MITTEIEAHSASEARLKAYEMGYIIVKDVSIGCHNLANRNEHTFDNLAIDYMDRLQLFKYPKTGVMYCIERGIENINKRCPYILKKDERCNPKKKRRAIELRKCSNDELLYVGHRRKEVLSEAIRMMHAIKEDVYCRIVWSNDYPLWKMSYKPSPTTKLGKYKLFIADESDYRRYMRRLKGFE